jgi:hypothetical protein
MDHGIHYGGHIKRTINTEDGASGQLLRQQNFSRMLIRRRERQPALLPAFADPCQQAGHCGLGAQKKRRATRSVRHGGKFFVSSKRERQSY